MSIILRGLGSSPRLITRGYGAIVQVWRELIQLVSPWK